MKEPEEKNKLPSFHFYPKDLLSDSTAMFMPNEALGIYIKLLCHDWINDGIPNNKNTIMTLGNYNPLDAKGEFRPKENYEYIYEIVRSKFIDHPKKPNFLTNSRLLKEKDKYIEFQNQKSKAGKIGAKMRWQNHDSVKDLPKADDMAKDGFSLSLSTSKSNKNICQKLKNEIRHIFEHYVKVFNKTSAYAFSDKRKKLIEKSLKRGHSTDDVKKAISAMSLDTWIDRPKFNDLKYAIGEIKGEDKVEYWLSIPPQKRSQNRYDTEGEKYDEAGKYGI